jgi:hypothetical protein
VDIITTICGRKLGTAQDPERFGVCTRELNHGTRRGGWRGCSSPELRKYQREATKASREKQHKAKAAKEAAPASEVANVPESAPFSEAQWWEGNIRKLSPERLQELLAQQERVLDQIHWLEHGHKIPDTNPDYVSLPEGFEDAVSFIEETGTVKFGPFCFGPDEQVEPEVKNNQDIWSQKYWLYERAFAKICAINKPTEIYARFGICISLPDSKLRDFTERVRKRPYKELGGELILDEQRWKSGKDWTDYPSNEEWINGPPQERVSRLLHPSYSDIHRVVPGPPPQL